MNQVITNNYKPGDDLKSVISDAVLGIGGIEEFVKKGEKVLIKPNVNTADPFPASSDPEFIKAVVELVLATGAGEVIVGESSTRSQNTRTNLEKLNLFDLEKIDQKVKVISFDEGQWVKKEIKDGKYLKSISVPEVLDQVDKVIFLPCLKTHCVAKFTGALKLGVGLMKKSQRMALHVRHTEQKVAEMNLAFKPDLIIMDGRKCFITDGPSHGEVREPGIILASTSRIQIDLEAIRVIQSFSGNDLEKFKPEELPQMKRALEIGIK